jgi:hypothetical protein
MNGEWDLRGGVDDYLGRVAFAGQRVLNWSRQRFLPSRWKKRGAEVVSVEVTAEHGWDPYPVSKLEEISPRQIVMERLKNLPVQSRLTNPAKVHYGDVYNLPAARTIRHRSDNRVVTLPRSAPIVEQCERWPDRSSSPICSTRFEGTPVAASRPLRKTSGTPGGISARNFSPSFRRGFTTTSNLTHQQYHLKEPTRFTIIDIEWTCALDTKHLL